MGFIHGFGGAKSVLRSIKKGSCTGPCRSSWLKIIKRAIKVPTNPLKLTSAEKKELKEMIQEVSGKRIAPSKTVLARRAMPYNPKRYAYKKKRSKDGEMYISLPNSKGTFAWKLYQKGMEKKISTKGLEKKLLKKGLRPSPTVSATLHCGKKKRGNDGHMYLSKENKLGVCRWVKIK